MAHTPVKVKKHYFANPQRDATHDTQIKAYLADRPSVGMTYNAIAKALGLDVFLVLNALQAMVISDPDVIEYFPQARCPASKTTDKKRLERLFRHAPERKLIDLRPERTDKVIIRILTEILLDGPKSKRYLYQAMRDRLVHIDERIVDRCMAAMDLVRLGYSKSTTKYALSTPDLDPV